MKFETLTLIIDNGVATLEINRPSKANAMSMQAWQELRQALELLDVQAEVRVIILRGSGQHFCSGIDLEILASFESVAGYDGMNGARAREKLQRWILEMQDYVTAFERCRKPVIAAIHGFCLGGGIDIITACDMRYSTVDASFSIKEIDLAITADMGTIQRLPALVGEGIARELIFTGRNFDGLEARSMRLVSCCYESKDALFSAVSEIARGIAAKSPLAIRGCKQAMHFSRENSIAASLNYVATWNSATLISDDLREALSAHKENRLPQYQD